MKLYTFEIGQNRRIGAEWQGTIVDLAVAFEASMPAPQPNRPRALPNDMLAFIRMGAPALEAAREALAFVKKRRAVPVGEQIMYPIEAVKLRAPILRPGKIICCELNLNPPTAAEPSFYFKVPSAVIGVGEPIVKPRSREQITSNAQLAVAIGKRMRNTAEEEVLGSAFGFSLLNDITARNGQLNESQVSLAKNCDTFCPIGPCIVNAEEIPDLSTLQLRTSLNGAPTASTATNWILQIPKLLSSVSLAMTLEPGDIVSVGVQHNPPVSVTAGDVIAIEAEGIGKLENQIIGG